MEVKALVDTGSSQSIIARRLVNSSEVTPSQGKVVTVDGSALSFGTVLVPVLIGNKSFKVSCMVLENLLSEFDLVLGMDIVKKLGGLVVSANDNTVQFGLAVSAAATIEIDDVDFKARFDGEKWTVRWKWAGEEPALKNKVSCYNIREDLREKFDEEVTSWIDEGILVPVPEGEEVGSVLPLMAVDQVNKGKVRPVLDFKELNQFVRSHTGESAVCEDTLRKWRKVGNNLSVGPEKGLPPATCGPNSLETSNRPVSR